MSFAHLHLHTEYSLLDGAARIVPLAERVKALGMSAAAITDHGVMYGVIDFDQAMRAQGLQPIIGCEVYVAPGDRRDKAQQLQRYAHLVLLAQDNDGYQNLIKLCSLGFTEGFYYRPRIDYGLLKEYSGGLIALSACLSGDIPRLLMEGDYDAARKLALNLSDTMGQDNFYLELQDHGIPEQRMVNEGIMRLHRDTGLPLVATNDVHYLNKGDAEAQEVLMCVQTNKSMSDEEHMTLGPPEFYVKSEEEMAALFPYAREAIENTQRIADRCDVRFTFGKYHLPVFLPPEGMTPPEHMRALCDEGLERLYAGKDTIGEARERLDYELSMIERMGFVDYFLIVWDFIRFAKEKGIMVGPGRGSGASSICAYLMGITGVDPIAYNLMFERFINPERVSMPDFDIDFCYERRGEVIDYVNQKYGADHVCQIITFGTMAARGSLRDVGRALGMSYAEVDRIAKMVPFALDMTLEKALSMSPELSAAAVDPQVGRLIDLAKAVEGLPRHASTHAAGVVIANRPVMDYVPLQTNNDLVTTQFPMTTIERLGLLKMDFLGLRTLTVLRDCLDMVGDSLSVEDIPLDDRETYERIGRGETDGMFQLESAGMRRVATELKPETTLDIASVISLYRPGPMESIPKFIKGKHDPSSVTYKHPLLEPILRSTYGCIVDQEQVMQIVKAVAGYSTGRADLIRRIMSKKKRGEMEREREVFLHGLVEDGEVKVPGALRMGVPLEVAESIIDEIAVFASYAFARGHAAPYAHIVYWTAYCAQHYPLPYLAALMNSMMGQTEKIAAYVQTVKGIGKRLLPPDVNRSGTRFTVEEDGIRFGLLGVRNTGRHAAEEIIQKRAERPFADIDDFLARVDADIINKRAMESMIQAGCFDSLSPNRAQLAVYMTNAHKSAANLRKNNAAGQVSLFEDVAVAQSLKPPPPPNVPDYPSRMKLVLEKEMTGVYLSGHPLSDYEDVLNTLQSAAAILSLQEEHDAIDRFDGMPAEMGGMVLERRNQATRNGELMAFVKLEDLTGVIEMLVFPKTLAQFNELFAQDSAIRVKGRLSLREDEEPKLLVSFVEPLKTAKETEADGARRVFAPEDEPMRRGSPGGMREPVGVGRGLPENNATDGGVTNGRAGVKGLCLMLEDKERVYALADLMERHRGALPVYIKTPAERLRMRYSVDPCPALISALEERIGRGNAKLF